MNSTLLLQSTIPFRITEFDLSLLFPSIENVDSSNFLSFYKSIDAVSINEDVLNVLLRNLLKKNKTYLQGVQSPDIAFVYNSFNAYDISGNAKKALLLLVPKVMDMGISLLSNTKETWMFRNKQHQLDRTNYIHSILGNNSSKIPYMYPVEQTLISFQGIDWLCNYGMYIFDFLKRRRDGCFVIDTLFLNKYEQQSESVPIGCKAIFELRKTGLYLVTLDYNGTRYVRKEYPFLSDGYIAIYSFHIGLKALVTICSHLTQSHLLIAAQQTHLNRTLLPDEHPLRIVLHPTDLNTINALFSSLPTLLSTPNCSQLYRIYQFTDTGFAEMIQDHVREYRYDFMRYMGEEFMPWLNLTKEEQMYPPFYTFFKWHAKIRKFADEFVNTIGQSLMNDSSTTAWLSKVYPYFRDDLGVNESIKRIVGFVYFEQVRHEMCDPEYFQYISPLFQRLRQNEKGEYYYSFENLFYIMLTITETQLEFPKMTLDCSFLMQKYPKLQRVWARFYREMQTWDSKYDSDKRLHPLLTPGKISISTGY